MPAVDLIPIVQPILAAASAVITGLLAVYVPKAISAFDARTGIQQTDQQRATILGAVQTAAGILETDLDKGVLNASHINISNTSVVAQAQAAINAVPTAAGALGLTIPDVARMIVGKVDTAAHGAPPVAGNTAVIVNSGTVS